MKRAPAFALLLLLAVTGFAQQTTTPNDQDRPVTHDQTYNRPVDTGRGWGNWGLLGLLGLAGLLGRRRDTTATVYNRDDKTFDQQRRRVG